MSIFAREINKLNNNMKRFFISAIVTMSCFMANAQTISIPEVNLITGGEKTVSVSLEGATDYTAFQFDIALPTGVTVKSVGMDNKPDTRKIETGTVGDKFRVLSYDEGNAPFTSESVLSLTFAASDDAATEEAETAAISTIVVVKGDGTGSDDGTGSVAINVSDKVKITIPAGEKLAMVSAYALDFTSLEEKGVKAYICTGNEKSGNKDKFWLTRVNDIPANTPILVKGPAGEYDVPQGNASIYYPENFLRGNANSASSVNWDDSKNYVVILDQGTIQGLPTSVTSLDAGKAYFHVPSTIASNVASSSQEIEIPAGLKLAMVSDYDLDFSDVEDLKAYTVTGYGKNRAIWLTRVMKACAGTPLMLRATTKKTYIVPSSTANATYVNMLDGNTSSDAVLLNPTIGDNTILVLILDNGTIAKLGVENAPFAKGKAWLPVPTSYYESGVSSARGMIGKSIEEEAEVICLEAMSLDGENDGTTGIRSMDEILSDTWYNLNGQRIDTPTKKGLYILNGRKVVVK